MILEIDSRSIEDNCKPDYVGNKRLAWVPCCPITAPCDEHTPWVRYDRNEAQVEFLRIANEKNLAYPQLEPLKETYIKSTNEQIWSTYVFGEGYRYWMTLPRRADA